MSLYQSDRKKNGVSKEQTWEPFSKFEIRVFFDRYVTFMHDNGHK